MPPRRVDELSTEGLFLGSRRTALRGLGRTRIERLMRLAGIEALYPKPRLSRAGRVRRSTPT